MAGGASHYRLKNNCFDIYSNMKRLSLQALLSRRFCGIRMAAEGGEERMVGLVMKIEKAFERIRKAERLDSLQILVVNFDDDKVLLLVTEGSYDFRDSVPKAMQLGYYLEVGITPSRTLSGRLASAFNSARREAKSHAVWWGNSPG